MGLLQARARVRTKTALAPAAINTSAQAETVAPVVKTSSTSRIVRPATIRGWGTSKAPATVSRRPFHIQTRAIFFRGRDSQQTYFVQRY